MPELHLIELAEARHGNELAVGAEGDVSNGTITVVPQGKRLPLAARRIGRDPEPGTAPVSAIDTRGIASGEGQHGSAPWMENDTTDPSTGLSGIRQVRLDRREIRQELVITGVVVIAQVPQFDLTFRSPQGNDGVGLFASQGAAPFPWGEGDVSDLVVPVSKLAPLVHLRESSADESQSPVFIVSLRCRSLILLGELHRLQDMPELQGWLGFHGGLHG